jgi:hypothetical protein
VCDKDPQEAVREYGASNNHTYEVSRRPGLSD